MCYGFGCRLLYVYTRYVLCTIFVLKKRQTKYAHTLESNQILLFGHENILGTGQFSVGIIPRQILFWKIFPCGRVCNEIMWIQPYSNYREFTCRCKNKMLISLT